MTPDVPETLPLVEIERIVLLEAFNRLCGRRNRIASELQMGVRTVEGKYRQFGVANRDHAPVSVPWLPQSLLRLAREQLTALETPVATSGAADCSLVVEEHIQADCSLVVEFTPQARLIELELVRLLQDMIQNQAGDLQLRLRQILAQFQSLRRPAAC